MKNQNGGRTVRNRLLGAVHVAKTRIGLADEHYRLILEGEFGRTSAADLSEGQLRKLLNIFARKYGWQGPKSDRAARAAQARALRDRCVEEAMTIPDGLSRLEGLVKSVARVDRLEWCRDPKPLTRILAILANIRQMEVINARNNR